MPSHHPSGARGSELRDFCEQGMGVGRGSWRGLAARAAASWPRRQGLPQATALAAALGIGCSTAKSASRICSMRDDPSTLEPSSSVM